MVNYTGALVTIAAVDFEQLWQFYAALLQQQPQIFIPKIYAEFNLKGLQLGIFSPKEDRQDEFSDSLGSGMSLCLEVENLEQAIADLAEMGYPFSGEIVSASHGREIYIYDPAFNRLILHQSK
jgi:predicted enzyme related to lactoylglutathione lyase